MSEKDVMLYESSRYPWLESLKRHLAPFKVIATTITMASMMTGIVPLTQEGLVTGGPVLMVFGFAFTGLMVLTIVLSLAEIASSFPGVKGGLVEYTRRLSPPGHRWQRIGPWIVGWLHFLAYVSLFIFSSSAVPNLKTLGTSSVIFSFALFASAGVQLAYGGAAPPRILTVAFHVGASLLCGLINACKIELNLLSMAWHTIGAIVVLITVIAAQREPPSISWAFTHFENQTGWSNNVYVCLLGMLLGGYTFTGYDGPIHTEYNTADAARKVPKGMLVGFLAAFGMGMVLILTLLFAISNLEAVINPAVTGISSLEIFVLLLHRGGAICILLIFLGTFFFCAQAILRATSEIGHELATLNVLPWPEYFATTNRKEQPARVGWLVAGISSTLGLLYLINSTVLIALMSAVAIELNVVYTFPILTRLIFPDKAHARVPAGPFSLGRWSKPINLIAVTWAGLCTIVFCFPTAYPITSENMNYACCLFIATMLFILGYWQYSGQHWYGRVVKGDFASQQHHLDIIRTMTRELESQAYRRDWEVAQARQQQEMKQQQQPHWNVVGDCENVHHMANLQYLTREKEARHEAHVMAALGYPCSSTRDEGGRSSQLSEQPSLYTEEQQQQQNSHLHELTRQALPVYSSAVATVEASTTISAADMQNHAHTGGDRKGDVVQGCHYDYQQQHPSYGQGDYNQDYSAYLAQGYSGRVGADAKDEVEEMEDDIESIREEDLEEIEQWLDRMERDLRDSQAQHYVP